MYVQLPELAASPTLQKEIEHYQDLLISLCLIFVYIFHNYTARAALSHYPGIFSRPGIKAAKLKMLISS